MQMRSCTKITMRKNKQNYVCPQLTYANKLNQNEDKMLAKIAIQQEEDSQNKTREKYQSINYKITT